MRVRRIGSTFAGLTLANRRPPRSSKRLLLSIATAVIATLTLAFPYVAAAGQTPNAASLSPVKPVFTLSATSGPTGSVITASSSDVCQDSRLPSADIGVTVTDPLGLTRQYSPGTLASGGGWVSEPLYMLAQGGGSGGFVPGTYVISAFCFATATTYQSQTFVASRALTFAVTPQAQSVGGVLTIAAVDSCPVGATIAVAELRSGPSNSGGFLGDAVGAVGAAGGWNPLSISVPSTTDPAISVSVLCYSGQKLLVVYAPQVVTIILGGSGTGVYVAMGDSYSSGQGESPYLPGSDQTKPFKDQCHRSPQAYGPLLAAADGLGKIVFVACSGAVTQDLLLANHFYPTEMAQVLAIPVDTTTVTLTIGGNDLGFRDVLDKCMRFLPTHRHGYGCSTSKSLNEQIAARLDALAGAGTGRVSTPDGTLIFPIKGILAAIHQRAPHARIYVAGYPALFGADFRNYAKAGSAPSGRVCQVYPATANFGSLDYYDAQWIDAEGVKLNQTIAKAVSAAVTAGVPVTYVSGVPAAFKGHGLCDSSASWIFGLHVNVKGVFNPFPWSFHPTATGQKSGYEAAFLQTAGL